MKKGMVYVTALLIASALLFSGCGEMRDKDDNTLPPTSTPMQTMLPESMTPDPEDGVVRDRDGIITDSDSGTVNGGAGYGTTGGIPETNGSGIPNTAKTGDR